MAEPDSTNVTAELLRRQSENQIRVAQATEQAAQYSMRNARYGTREKGRPFPGAATPEFHGGDEIELHARGMGQTSREPDGRWDGDHRGRSERFVGPPERGAIECSIHRRS